MAEIAGPRIENAGPKVQSGPVSGRDLLQRLQEGVLETETGVKQKVLGSAHMTSWNDTFLQRTSFGLSSKPWLMSTLSETIFSI